ncbi:MAG: pilus assembly protein [Lachnospiraceae bacterium]|nr:pilus assembly protein [Lachnospiraceae bacterium]
MKRQRGSITVEAAFLLLFLMLLLVFVLWLALYLHDRLVIENAVQRLYGKAEDYMIYGTEPYSGYLSKRAMTDRGLLYAVASSRTKAERMEEWLYNELGDRLFLFRPEGAEVKKTGCYMEVEAVFCCRRPPLFSWIIPEKICEVTWKKSVLFTVREELTRAASVLLRSR